MPLFLRLHDTSLSDINMDITAVPAARRKGGKCWHRTGGATCGQTVHRPGWDRLRWEFTISERAGCQTSATHLHSSDGVSAAHHPLTLERGRRQGTSSCCRWGPRGPARDSGWSGACLPESIQRIFWIDIELAKIYYSALMNQYFYPPLHEMWCSMPHVIL